MSIDTDALMRAVECVCAFFLIGTLGFVLARKGWVSNESANMLAKMVTSVIIPINLFHNINTSTSKEDFLPILHYVFIPVISILVVMGWAAITGKILGMRRARKHVFITAASCSNTINIGLPINLLLFGTDAIPAVLVYYVGNTIVFWTIGNYMMASNAEGAAEAKLVSAETLGKIFSPPVLGFLAGFALLLCNVRIPPLLGIATGQMAGMTTPLSILCIGIAIYQTGVGNIRLTRDVGLIAAGRFVASPVVMGILLWMFPVPEIVRNVFIIQCSLPPMTNIALLAMRYKCDESFAAVSVSFCTLCALLTVPVFMVLVSSALA